MFYFRLAKELGMTVGMLLKNIDSYELTEWIAYSKYEQEEPEDNSTKLIEAQLGTLPFTVNKKTVAKKKARGEL